MPCKIKVITIFCVATILPLKIIVENLCWMSNNFQELSSLNFLRTFQALNFDCNSRTFKELPSILPCEQRFLSCMTFSVYEVIRMAFLSGKQTNYATDKPREQLHQCQKQCKRENSAYGV